jgi:hypothetical protein
MQLILSERKPIPISLAAPVTIANYGPAPVYAGGREVDATSTLINPGGTATITEEEQIFVLAGDVAGAVIDVLSARAPEPTQTTPSSPEARAARRMPPTGYLPP